MAVGVLLVTALTGCGGNDAKVSTDVSTSMEKVIGALGEAFEGEKRRYYENRTDKTGKDNGYFHCFCK